MSDLLPCRFCGAECHVETFSSPLVKATTWICSNNRYFGGTCEDQRAYLYAQAWQDAMKSKDLPQGDERLLALLNEAESKLGDEQAINRCLSEQLDYVNELVRSKPDDVRESVARAIFIARSWQTAAVGDWDDADESERENYRKLADAAITAIGSQP